MLGYLRLMADSILSLGISNYGMDQAIHNVLLHSDKVAGATIVRPASGRVSNLQDEQYGIVNGTRRRDAIGNSSWVQNLKFGHTTAIVHQYDRYPELTVAFLERYVHWDVAADEAKRCARFQLWEGVDRFSKNRCDVESVMAFSQAACCDHCLSRPDSCRAWTAKPWWGGTRCKSFIF